MASNKTTFYLKVIIWTVIFVIIGGYAIIETRAFFNGTRLYVNTPTSGQTFTEPLVTVTGSVEAASTLEIGTAKVIPDANGNFEYPIVLGLGYNVIVVRATDRFDRETTSKIDLYYEPSPEKLLDRTQTAEANETTEMATSTNQASTSERQLQE